MSARALIRLVAALSSVVVLVGVGVALYLRYQSPWPEGPVLTHRPVDEERALVVRADEEDEGAAHLLLVDRARGPVWSASFRGLQAVSPQAMRVEDGQVLLCAAQGREPATLRFDLASGQPAGIVPGGCDIHPVQIEIPREIVAADHRYVQSLGGHLFALDPRTRHVKAAARIERQDPAKHPVLREHFVGDRLWVSADEGVRVIDASTLRPIGGWAIAPPVVDVSERASRLLPEGY